MKRVVLLLLGLCLSAGIAIAQDVCPPGKVIDLSVATGKTTAALSWTFSGDDCNTGTATTYKILRSNSPFDDTNWINATVVQTSSPGSPGTLTCVDLSFLSCNTSYWWAVLMIDEAGNKTLSNVVQKSTAGCNTTLEVTC